MASSSTRVRSKAKRRAATWKDHVQDRLPAPVRRIVAEARSNDVFLLAASLAFYAFVSIAPLTIVVLWFVSMVLGEQRLNTLATELGRSAPSNLRLDGLLRQVADAGARGGLVGILTGLWPATSYGAGLQRAFHRLGNRPSRDIHGLRGRGLFSLLLIPVFLVGGLVASYAGSQAPGGGGLGRTVGVGLALAIGFATAAAGLVVIYRIYPPVRLPWPSIWRAVVWTATTDAVLTVLLVLYLSSGTDVRQHYVTTGLAMLVLLAVWLFLGNVMLLVGYRIGLDTRR